MTLCEQVQLWLADPDPGKSALSQELVTHLTGCEQCQTVSAQLKNIDAALRALPAGDAPDDIIASVLRKLGQKQSKAELSAFNERRHWLARGLATAAVILAVIGIAPTWKLVDMPALDMFAQYQESQVGLSSSGSQKPDEGYVADVLKNEKEADKNGRYRVEAPARQVLPPQPSTESANETFQVLLPQPSTESANETFAAGDSSEIGQSSASVLRDEVSEAIVSFANKSSDDETAPRPVERGDNNLLPSLASGLISETEAELNLSYADTDGAAMPGSGEQGERRYSEVDHAGRLGGKNARANLPSDVVANGQSASAGALRERAANGPAKDQPAAPASARRLSISDQKAGEDRRETADPALLAKTLPRAEPEPQEEQKRSITKKEKKPAPEKPAQEKAAAMNRVLKQDSGAAVIPGSAVDRFRRRDALQNLRFQATDGYWQNTYLPGDPVFRRIKASALDWNQKAAQSRPRIAPLLLRQTQNTQQPFDEPENSALGLFLHADKASIQQPGRVRLQVGLKGASRRGGQRPAMNIAVVLDLSGKKAHESAVYALLNSLAKAKQPGDRFSLIIAGSQTGLAVDPENFRYGPLTIALKQAFSAGRRENQTSLSQAMLTASENIAQNSDPGALLGSSLILLISPSPIDAALPELTALAHRNAVNGIHLSVINLGELAAMTAAKQLVMAGHGNLRVLYNDDEAEAVIERELFSASRAVARALRLRIRLAPEVKLVDIIGSRRLEEPDAQRVREAEQSIDQRLAQNLGIQSDRGEDEEGIQIVIPQFNSGAEHIIMLDLVVTRPGPIADVSVRYKDLVYSRNSSVRAQLSLSAETQSFGPLEQNVVKNHLALTQMLTLERAGEVLAAGQYPTAQQLLTSAYALLTEMRSTVPGWLNDAELIADQALLNNYLAIMQEPALINNAADRPGLTASLRYAGLKKIHGDNLDE